MKFPYARFLSITFTVLFAFVYAAQAATFTVNSTLDNESNGCAVGACTLREAVTAANSNGEVDAIFFDPAIFGVSQTITLNGSELPTVPSGTTLSINGPGADRLTVSGNNASSLIDGFSNSFLTISNLSIRSTSGVGSPAITSSGILTLDNVTFRDNQNFNGTSAIYNFGTASIINCSFNNNFNFAWVIANRGTMNISNSAFTGNIGATGSSVIYNNGGTMTITRTRIRNNNSRAVDNSRLSTADANLTVMESEFSNNISASNSNGGGGILNKGTVSIFSSTISVSTANRGGAIASEEGSVSLTNTTIFGNQATASNANYLDDYGGGGLWLQNTSATITNTTIYKNDSLADTGGLKKIGTTTISVANSIIAGNIARTVSYFGIPINNPDAYGTFNTRGGNIIGVTSPNNVTLNGGWSGSMGDKTDVNVASIGLSVNLADNGGFAPTVAINCCGLAVGGGRTQGQSGFPAPSTDQRRVPRVNNSGSERNDAGAFQYTEKLPATQMPDLTAASDTGISNADNITNSRAPVIKITGAIANAKIYFLRNGSSLSDASADGNGEAAFTDPNPSANGSVNYSTKQDIPGTGSDESQPLNVVYDTTAPTVTINQANGQADPATTQPVNFTVAFSEAIYNFDASDVSFSNSTADLSAANISASGSGANYTISVENILTVGRIVVDVAANQASDAAGNVNPAALFTDPLVNYVGNGQVLVTKTADGSSCTASDCSLRGALSLVGSVASPTGININFNIPAGDPNCASGTCTIYLGGEQLTVNYLTPVIIDGGAGNKIVISASGQSRVFYSCPSANATLKNLILRDGSGTSAAFSAENGDGGGIVNRGT